MLSIAIPQLYCGASGKKGAYNRQEVGLARAFASLGCRAIVLYPDPAATAVTAEDLEPEVRILTCPASKFGVSALYKSWKPLLDEGVDAVHCMGDNALGVPGLYKFCQKQGIAFYSQLGAVRSTSGNALVRVIMDLLCRRNLRIYRATPTFAKTPALQAELQSLGVPCTGVMPVGLDTAIIPAVPVSKTEARRALGLDLQSSYLLFVGRLDAYKRPLDLLPLLKSLPDTWQAVVIGSGSLSAELAAQLQAQGLAGRCRCIQSLPNAAVQAYYHACDVFVNLNPEEIFGMSLLEAMYAACPPVARHAPGPDLIIQDGVSGLFADTIPALAAAVQRAAADPNLGIEAQKRIYENFLWANSAEKGIATIRALRRKGGTHHG